MSTSANWGENVSTGELESPTGKRIAAAARGVYANNAAIRELAGVAGAVVETVDQDTLGDGYGGRWRRLTGASAGHFVHDGLSCLVATAGDGSAAWLKESGPIHLQFPGSHSFLRLRPIRNGGYLSLFAVPIKLRNSALVWFDVGISPQLVVVQSGNEFAIDATQGCDGTTGADTFITVFSNGGYLWVENRTLGVTKLRLNLFL